jgi:hypothetical protein
MTNEWIAIAQEKPPIGKEIFVYINEHGYENKGIMCTGMISSTGDWRLKIPRFLTYFIDTTMHVTNIAKFNEYLQQRITHWRPLIEGPNIEETKV